MSDPAPHHRRDDSAGDDRVRQGWRAGAVDERMRAALSVGADEIRRALADEVEAALGDWDRLPEDVRFRFADLLHRLRTGRDT